MSVVYGKLAISLLGTFLVLILLWKKNQLSEWLETQNWKVMISAGWILTRLLPFVALYIILGNQPTSDVNGFWDEASKASMGQIVYKDFWSPYSPFYAYFIGIWLKLWYSPKMIVFVMTVMDGVAIWVSWHFFRPFFTSGKLIFLFIHISVTAWFACALRCGCTGRCLDVAVCRSCISGSRKNIEGCLIFDSACIRIIDDQSDFRIDIGSIISAGKGKNTVSDSYDFDWRHFIWNTILAGGLGIFATA